MKFKDNDGDELATSSDRDFCRWFISGAFLLASGCSPGVSDGLEILPSNECTTDDECDEAEFCLVEWYGKEPRECEPRSDVGETCSDQWPCLEGLTCTSANWCAASATGELGPGPGTAKGEP